MTDPLDRGEILDEAKRLTMRDRRKDYGDPVGTHASIATMWSEIMRQPVTDRQVALCMAALKIVRACHSPATLDHYADGAAYLAIAGECAGAGQKPDPRGSTPVGSIGTIGAAGECARAANE